MNALKEIFDQIRGFLWPNQAAAWQTLVWMSIFSWLMSSLATLPNDEFALLTVRDMIAICGWLFLIPGIHWLLHEEPVKKFLTIGEFFIGPWITGALTAYFLFSSLSDRYPSVMFVSWPIISAIIAAIPKFIKLGPTWRIPEPPVRQELIILILSNLLLSCWLQLHFSLQNLLQDYPSLLSDDFDRSAFVVRRGDRTPPVSRGETVLAAAESILESGQPGYGQLEGRPWSETERWLLNVNQEVTQLETQVRAQLAATEEDDLWRLQGRVFSGNPDYVLQLSALWQGPSSQPQGFYLTKSCRINQVGQSRGLRPAAPTSLGTTTIACEPTTQPQVELPTPTAQPQ